MAAGLPELGLAGDRHTLNMRTLQAASTLGQCVLMQMYRQALAGHGLQAGQVLLVPFAFVIRSQFVHAGFTLRRMLELGVVPLVNENDAVVAPESIRWGDNDRIAALVANLVSAELLVLLTDTAGVLTADPRHHSEASLIAEIARIDPETVRRMGGPGSSRGSGGMASKLTAARVASWSGVPTVIADARRPHVLADAVAGVPGVGTRIPARHSSLSARKLWICFAIDPVGEVVVDAGARAALERGRSLLAIGVRGVVGDFDAGEPVDVRAQGGDVFARGLARQASRELRQSAGLRSEELPDGVPHVVIHADDLVVIPV